MKYPKKKLNDAIKELGKYQDLDKIASMLERLNGTTNYEDFEFLLGVIRSEGSSTWFLAHFLDSNTNKKSYKRLQFNG